MDGLGEMDNGGWRLVRHRKEYAHVHTYIRTYAHRYMHIHTCIHTCIHTVNKYRFTGIVPFLRAKTVAKETVANENCHRVSHIIDLTCIVLCVGLVGRAA